MADKQMNASCFAYSQKRKDVGLDDITLSNGVWEGIEEYAYLKKLCGMYPVDLDPMCC
jgi:hypothetical protein